MVLVFCTLYHGDIPLLKVSRKYLKQFSSYRADIYCRNHYFQCSKGHNFKSRLSRSTTRVFCAWPQDALHLYEVLSKYLERFLTYRAVTNKWYRWPFSIFLSCSKVYKSRLTLGSAYPLMVLYIFEKFYEKSQMVFNLQGGHKYMVEMAMFNIQRAITPKIGKLELRFMTSARCLIKRSICVKFYQISETGF